MFVPGPGARIIRSPTGSLAAEGRQDLSGGGPASNTVQAGQSSPQAEFAGSVGQIIAQQGIHFSTPVSPESLKAFVELLRSTVAPRRQLVRDLTTGRAPDPGCIEYLDAVHRALSAMPGAPDHAVVKVGAHPITISIATELCELEQDLIFLQHGEEVLLDAIAAREPSFRQQLAGGLEFLGHRKYSHVIVDRDGTTIPYFERYSTSVQGVHNAVRLSRVGADRAATLTSAQLRRGGLLDVSTLPALPYALMGSGGRELFVPYNGTAAQWPIATDKQSLLDALNIAIENKLDEPAYEGFSYIGSGYQQKVGQTGIARQTHTHSIDPAVSQALKEWVTAEVRKLDPELGEELHGIRTGKMFSITDTGLDLEVTVNLEPGVTFTKANGVAFLAEQLQWDLSKGPNLVFGNTESDIPIIEEIARHSSDLRVIFVTPPGKTEAEEAERLALQEKVRTAAGGRAYFVDSANTATAIIGGMSRDALWAA